MKKGSTLFLRLAVIMLAAAVCLFAGYMVPKISAFAAELFPDQLYIAYLLAMQLTGTVIAFLVAIYHTLRLLGCIDRQEAFSDLSVRSLRKIKRSAFAISLLYIGVLPLLYFLVDADDSPGMLLIAIIIFFASTAIGVFAAVLESLLQEAVRYKSEIDWTV